jgi:hypothetical protein
MASTFHPRLTGNVTQLSVKMVIFGGVLKWMVIPKQERQALLYSVTHGDPKLYELV